MGTMDKLNGHLPEYDDEVDELNESEGCASSFITMVIFVVLCLSAIASIYYMYCQ